MTDFDVILQRLDAIGLQTAHNAFRATKQNPAPAPPFICWLSHERQRGSDCKNHVREITASIELYTDRKPDSELEKQIETKVLHDVEFQKYQSEIEDENMVQTAYDFNIIQKIGG